MHSFHMQSFNEELESIGFDKVARELTEAAKDKLPAKDFAVKPSKSNTGEEAYPIPDRQHARSALGFAKMHHDAADLAAVKKKIEAKYPDMLKGKEKDSNMGMGTYGPGSSMLPGMIGGPPGGTGMTGTGGQMGRM